MNAFERKLNRRFAELDEFVPPAGFRELAGPLKTITPGVVVDVHVKGKRAGMLRVGKTYPYYDLASLTKILFTSNWGVATSLDVDAYMIELPVDALK